MPTVSQLRGLPLERAELYGKPHVGARYTRGGRYEMTSDRCAVCRRMPESCHHVAPRRLGHTFTLSTPNGDHVLRSALFALCGGGTTGCHDGFHGGARYEARWVWDSPQHERWWWDGILLEKFGPHAPELYAFGRWVIYDRRAGRSFEIREGETDGVLQL